SRKASRATKARVLEHEHRGVVARTIWQRSQPPAADTLPRMSREERTMDTVAKSISEVGYVAQLKRRLGHKLRGEGASRRENEAPEVRTGLEDMLGRLRAEIERRKRSVEVN
ncbi:hypothetical protein FIBSPDRAFT_755162, partial [Athelia psychrophila]